MSEIRNITLKIMRKLMDKAQINNIEYEGPALALYTEHPEVFIENPRLMSELATEFKKRLVLRSDPQVRVSREEASRKIQSIMRSLGVSEENLRIFFDDMRGEVHIFIRGINGLSLKDVIQGSYLPITKETKWIPRFRMYYIDIPEVLKTVYSAYAEERVYRAKRILSRVGERVFRTPVRPSRDIRITGLGGVDEVGRSAILLETSESKILVDFGAKVNASKLIDYMPRIDSVDFLINDLDAIVLTHAHLDHSGMIPLLYKYGYDGPVYMTEPTLLLSVLLLKDFLEISRKSGFRLPFNMTDVKEMIRHAIILKYNYVTDVSPDIKLTFHNAGHILGSAMAHLHIREGVYNILFTGDFKFGPTRLLDPAYTDFARVETIVIESTYGSKQDVLPPRRQVEQEFIKFINKICGSGGKVLIPTPGVGRAQEILAVINYYRNLRDSDVSINDVNIYIDGMIDEANKIHYIYSEYLSGRIRRMLKNGSNPFHNEYVVPVKNSGEREEIIKSSEPAVILSTSGMMQGGPVIEYFINLAESDKNALVFVSYQSPNTLGRKLVDGVRRLDLLVEGRVRTVDVKMNVVKFDGFTGHSDRKQLLGFVGKLKNKLGRSLRNIYVVHGEPSKIRSLASAYINMLEVEAYPLKPLSTVLLKD